MWSSPFLDVTRSENCASSRPQDRRRSDTTVICDWVSGSPGLFFCRYNRWMALVGRCNKRDQPPVLINMFRHSPAADNDKMNCVFDFPKYFNRVCWWYLHVDEMIWLIDWFFYLFSMYCTGKNATCLYFVSVSCWCFVFDFVLPLAVRDCHNLPYVAADWKLSTVLVK